MIDLTAHDKWHKYLADATEALGKRLNALEHRVTALDTTQVKPEYAPCSCSVFKVRDLTGRVPVRLFKTREAAEAWVHLVTEGNPSARLIIERKARKRDGIQSAESSCSAFIAEVARIANDYIPADGSQVPLALSEMREALQSLLADRLMQESNATLQSENYEGECLDQSRHSGDCEIGQTTTGKINIALVDGVKRMALSFPLDHARRIHDRLGELLPNKKITTEETVI